MKLSSASRFVRATSRGVFSLASTPALVCPCLSFILSLLFWLFASWTANSLPLCAQARDNKYKSQRDLLARQVQLWSRVRATWSALLLQFCDVQTLCLLGTWQSEVMRTLQQRCSNAESACETQSHTRKLSRACIRFSSLESSRILHLRDSTMQTIHRLPGMK